MRIKELREQRGFTQKQVADALGCSPVTFLRYESGEREPSGKVSPVFPVFNGGIKIFVAF